MFKISHRELASLSFNIFWSSPGCTKTHLPGYVNDFEKFKNAGADVIACTSTDNVFALSEWGKINNAEGKVRNLTLSPCSIERF